MRLSLEGCLQKHKTRERLCAAALFLLGLNLSKSFTLVALLLTGGLWIGRDNIKRALGQPMIKALVLCLMLFGLSFSVRQYQLGFWNQGLQSVSDVLTYTLLPSACLVFGFVARQRWIGRSAVTTAAIAFAMGGLLYVLIALGISRDPWWNVAEVFTSGVNVPWSQHGQFVQNVRSVEQRAFPALMLLCCVPMTIAKKQLRWRSRSLLLLTAGIIAYYSLYALNGRLRYVALALSFTPYLFMIKQRLLRWFIFALAAAAVGLGLQFRWLCDERFPMQLAFLGHIQRFPWGGREISFTFHGCPGQGDFQFAPPPNFLHLPHNIFLDIVNDAGAVPALFLLIAASLSLITITREFADVAISGTWDANQMLRSGLVSALFCQSMWQPFLYSDRMIFVLSFLLTGALIAESEIPNNSSSNQASSTHGSNPIC